MAKIKKLCPELVEKLGEVKADIKRLERDEKELVELAKETWDEVKSTRRKVVDEDGNVKTTYTYRPKGCEYEAVLSVFKKREAKWKELFQELYTEVHGAKAYKKFVAKLPRVETTQLNIYDVQE